MKNKLHIFENLQQTAESVAEILSEKINRKNGFFYLAVSGGNTPKILFETLAERYAEKIRWNKLKLFWVDERCVLPTDKESNFGMTYNALLKHIPIPDENIFRIKGENNPETEAVEYQKKIEENLSFENNLPTFDLILLGMGDDGHTASIFPDNLFLLNVSDIVAVAKHPASGQKRITLTGRIIKNSAEIFFLITGKSKKEVFKQIFDDVKTAENLPSYHIIKATNAEIFADKEVIG